MHASTKSKLTRKYQITVPGVIRKKLDVHQGDLVEFKIVGDQIIIQKPEPIDWHFIQSLQETLNEWESEEDQRAYDKL